MSIEGMPLTVGAQPYERPRSDYQRPSDNERYGIASYNTGAAYYQAAIDGVNQGMRALINERYAATQARGSFPLGLDPLADGIIRVESDDGRSEFVSNRVQAIGVNLFSSQFLFRFIPRVDFFEKSIATANRHYTEDTGIYHLTERLFNLADANRILFYAQRLHHMRTRGQSRLYKNSQHLLWTTGLDVADFADISETDSTVADVGHKPFSALQIERTYSIDMVSRGEVDCKNNFDRVIRMGSNLAYVIVRHDTKLDYFEEDMNEILSYGMSPEQTFPCYWLLDCSTSTPSSIEEDLTKYLTRHMAAYQTGQIDVSYQVVAIVPDGGTNPALRGLPNNSRRQFLTDDDIEIRMERAMDTEDQEPVRIVLTPREGWKTLSIGTRDQLPGSNFGSDKWMAAYMHDLPDSMDDEDVKGRVDRMKRSLEGEGSVYDRSPPSNPAERDPEKMEVDDGSEPLRGREGELSRFRAPRWVVETYSIVLLGAQGSGRSSLARNFAGEEFDKNRIPLLRDRVVRQVDLHGTPVQITVTVIGDYERFRDADNEFIKKADAIVLVYDTTNQQSAYNLYEQRRRIKDIRRPDAPVVVVGTKTDATSDDATANIAAGLFADGEKWRLFLVDSKTSVGVENLFTTLVREIKDAREKASVKPAKPAVTEKEGELFKVILTGDFGVGKTSMLFSSIGEEFQEAPRDIPGVDFKDKIVDLGGVKAKLRIWDTQGQERFRTVTASYYKRMHGLMLVFDVQDKKSAEHLQKWYEEFERYGPETAQILVVGNKEDRIRDLLISEDTEAVKIARTFADSIGARFELVSAKDGTNVDRTFTLLATLMHEKKLTDAGYPDVTPSTGSSASVTVDDMLF